MQIKNVMLLKSKSEVRELVSVLKKDNKIIGFVPTMGALHEGHESLIKRAITECDNVIVSIFVNPTQFGPNEDFDAYPKQLEQDIEICQKLGVSAIFAPVAEEMYSNTECLTSVIPPESLKNKMCGKSRKGHFDGVATVVLKLFNIVQPDNAYFGMKDAQQLFIIKKMVRDLDIPVNIIGCPIVRESSGLAMSSRNSYLSVEAKDKAVKISKVLESVRNEYLSGKILDVNQVMSIAKAILDAEISIEYLEMYNYQTLMPVNTVGAETLIAIAVKIDGIRLIDNLLI